MRGCEWAGRTRKGRELGRAIRDSKKPLKRITKGAVARGLAKEEHTTEADGWVYLVPAGWLVVPREWK
jgi:hypothetical protein